MVENLTIDSSSRINTETRRFLILGNLRLNSILQSPVEMLI